MDVEVITIERSELERLIEATVTRALQRVLSPPDEIMNKADVAKYLKKSPATITRLMKKGLPSHGPGRPTFKRSEIDRWQSLN